MQDAKIGKNQGTKYSHLINWVGCKIKSILGMIKGVRILYYIIQSPQPLVEQSAKNSSAGKQEAESIVKQK
jgi:hypothetical protein